MKTFSNILTRILPAPLFFAAFLIPLKEKGNWQELKYKKIPSHKVEYTSDGLKIHVNKSAMPLIYPFDKSIKVKKIIIKGKIDQLLHFKDKNQGLEGYDDFAFQLGLVVPGERTLNFFEKAIAAKWITTLFDLAPKDSGVDHIMFFRARQDNTLIKSAKEHPMGKGLIKVKDKWIIDKTGEFKFETEIEETAAVALWLSCDGDDSESKFNIQFSEITFE